MPVTVFTTCKKKKNLFPPVAFTSRAAATTTKMLGTVIYVYFFGSLATGIKTFAWYVLLLLLLLYCLCGMFGVSE